MTDQKIGSSRGRPKNSGPHQANDAILLPRIADRKLVNSGQPIAAIIRELVNTERDTGGVRRLQRAFKAQNAELMEAARRRYEKKRIQDFNRSLIIFAEGVHRVTENFIDKINTWSRTPEGRKVNEWIMEYQRIANSPELRKWAAVANDSLLYKLAFAGRN